MKAIRVAIGASCAIFALSNCGAYAAQPKLEPGWSMELARKMASVGTLQVTSDNITMQGRTRSCGFTFTHVLFDFAPAQNNLLRATGSFYVNDFSGNIAPLLKIGVDDNFMTSKSKAFAPASAYIRAPLGGATKPTRLEADRPEYGVWTYPVDSNFNASIREIIENRKMTVGFNRVPNGRDLIAPLDLTTVGIDDNGNPRRSSTVVDDFVVCLNQLLQQSDVSR